MNDDKLILEFLEDYVRIENEIKLLSEDKKHLFENIKNKVDLKALRAAIQIAKIRSRLGDSEVELDKMFDAVSKKMTL